MRKRTEDDADLQPRVRSGHVLNPLVALLAHQDERVAADIADVFEDVACDWRLVRVADGSAAARHIMNKGLPELLITCPDLPEVNGPDLVEWMRSFRCARAVPVLVHGEPADIDAREQLLRNEVRSIVPADSSRQVLAGHLARLVALVEKVRFPQLA